MLLSDRISLFWWGYQSTLRSNKGVTAPCPYYIFQFRVVASTRQRLDLAPHSYVLQSPIFAWHTVETRPEGGHPLQEGAGLARGPAVVFQYVSLYRHTHHGYFFTYLFLPLPTIYCIEYNTMAFLLHGTSCQI